MFHPVPIVVHEISDDELEPGEIDGEGTPPPPAASLPVQDGEASSALARVKSAEDALQRAAAQVETLALSLREACAQATAATAELAAAHEAADDAFVHVAPFSEALNLNLPLGTTVRVFAHFPTSEPELKDEAMLNLFRPWGALCCHTRTRTAGDKAFTSLHFSNGWAAKTGVSMVNGTPLPSGAVLKVEVAPPALQLPCSICARLPGFVTEEEEAAAAAEAGVRRVRPRTDDGPPPAAFSPPPPAFAPASLTGCELLGPGEIVYGILHPAAGYAHCGHLLERLGERVQFRVLDKDKDEVYACAIALGAEATDAARAVEPWAVPQGGIFRCSPRSDLEACAQASLPQQLVLRPRPEGGEGEARQGWRLLLQPSPLPMIRARSCDYAHLRSWQHMLTYRQLACALDLDDTVVKSFTVNGLCAEVKRMELELGEAVAQRRQPAEGVARLEARLKLCCWWAKAAEEYQQNGTCTRLSGWAVPANGLRLGAEERVTTTRYTSYRIPAGADPAGAGGPLGCEVLLLKVSNAALMVCIRPGWPALRETLRKHFFTVVTTHATAEYAAEVVRVLDPAQGNLQLLRNGGLEQAAWQKHVMPTVQLPAWVDAEEKAAAVARPMLTHVVSFRKKRSAEFRDDGEVPFGATSDQTTLKNFVALRGCGYCSNAFVALDDLNGRGRASGIWDMEDVGRVICPPGFHPFGPPEDRVLERCSEALKGVHNAFFDARTGGAALALSATCLASQLLERHSQLQRERLSLPFI